MFLFGSRLDDKKKGGDIDLLIRTENEKKGVLARIRMLSRLKLDLGDQKIDIIGDHEDSSVAREAQKKWNAISMTERKQEIAERLEREFEVCDKHILRINEALKGLGLDLPMSADCSVIDFDAFFSIKGFSHYPTSVLSRMFGGKKDILYSFMAQDNIDWRNVIYRITTKLIGNVAARKDFQKSHLPAVLIGDDSDLFKSGMKMESIGKIFSHMHQKCILGYKALMLCWSDGRPNLCSMLPCMEKKGK